MYSYGTQKQNLFTDDGQRMFLAIRDTTQRLLKTAGACRCQEMIANCGGGDTWTMLACVDRMVELGEISEITGRDVCGQYRIFVSARD